MTTLNKISAKLPVTGTRLENELLICCARTCLDSKNAERLKTLLQEDIDWKYLIEIANLHGVMPLLYLNLSNHYSELVPQNVLTELQNNFYANASANLALTSKLVEILNLFEEHNIPVIPYKGPVLAAYVYGNLTLRQFGDLDILVRKQDVLKAKELLIDAGYQPREQLTCLQEEQLLKSYYRFQFRSNDGSVEYLELHWALGKKSCSWESQWVPIDFDIAPFWERLDSVSLAGKTVLHFPSEDLLLILCLHGAKDCWRSLKWLCDLSELIRTHPNLDWEWLIEQASKLNVERQFYLGLYLVQDLLGIQLPQKIWKRTQQPERAVTFLATQVRQRFLENPDSPPGKFEQFLFRFLREGHNSVWYFYLWRTYLENKKMRTKIRKSWNVFWFGIAPSDKDKEFLPLPESLSFLYYLIRPVRLLKEYGTMKYLRLLFIPLVILSFLAMFTIDKALLSIESAAPHDSALREALSLTYPSQDWQGFQQLEGAGRWDAIERIGEVLTAKDIAKSLALAEQMEPGLDKKWFLVGILSQWAESEPQSAANYLQAVSIETQNSAVFKVFSKWVESDPRTAATYLQSMPSGSSQDLAMSTIASKWAESDPKGAITWAQQLPETTGYDYALPIIGVAGHTNLVDIHYSRNHALQLIAFRWAEADFQAATAWAKQLPGGKLRDNVLRAIAFQSEN